MSREEGQGIVTLPGASDPDQRPAPRVGSQVDLSGQPPRDRASASRSHGLPAVAPPVARFLLFDPAAASRDAQCGHGQSLRLDVLGRLVPGPGRPAATPHQSGHADAGDHPLARST